MTNPLTPAPLQGESILILDDDSGVQELMGRVVAALGGVSQLASSIIQAQQQASAHSFGCAVIDKNLGGEDGLDFLRWLKVAQPDCEALIVTGYGNMQSAIEALRIGASDYLLKPFEVEIISHRLGLLCERRRSVRERSTLQAQLMQADRLATLGTLAAGVVHEINNPLTYVLSNLEFLERQLKDLCLRNPGAAALGAEFLACQGMVGETLVGARQMAAVVDYVKTFSHHGGGERMRTNLPHLLEGVLQMATVVIRQRATLKREFSEIPEVDALKFQLAQVFLNLLVNASQAIAANCAAQNVIGVRLATSAKGEAVIEISDTGSGMSEEVRSKLFQPFFTTKPPGEGTGIGLTICRNIVHSHGGRIEVESTLGKGSLFRVTLPAAGSGTDSSTEQVERSR